MPINLEEHGLNHDTLAELLQDSPGRVKVRLGNGKIIDLLREHLSNGLPDNPEDDSPQGLFERIHDKEPVPNPVFDKVYDKMSGESETRDLSDGVFTSSLSETELLKLRQVTGDLIKDKDYAIVHDLLKKP